MSTAYRQKNSYERTKSPIIINGGFLQTEKEKLETPLGLLLINGKILSELDANNKKLSGILYTVAGQPNIEFARTKVDLNGIEFALQAGPLLVEPGGRRGIHFNDRIRANRTVLCIADNDIIIVSVFSDAVGLGLMRNFSGGLSLFELSDILSLPANHGGFNCDRAINLVGGSYSQIYTAFGSRVGDLFLPVTRCIT